MQSPDLLEFVSEGELSPSPNGSVYEFWFDKENKQAAPAAAPPSDAWLSEAPSDDMLPSGAHVTEKFSVNELPDGRAYKLEVQFEGPAQITEIEGSPAAPQSMDMADVVSKQMQRLAELVQKHQEEKKRVGDDNTKGNDNKEEVGIGARDDNKEDAADKGEVADDGLGPDSEADEEEAAAVAQAVEFSAQSALLLIHPRRGFCSESAVRNLTEFLKNKHKHPLRCIIIAMHAKTGGIDTVGFWDWKQVPQANSLDVRDVEKRNVVPRDNKYREYVQAYVKEIKRKGRTKICLRDEDRDFEVDPRLVHLLKKEVPHIPHKVIKYGSNKATETISVLESEVRIHNDPGTVLNMDMVNALSPMDHVFLCGDQLGVHVTVRSMIKLLNVSKIVVLEDMLCDTPCFQGHPSALVIQTNDLVDHIEQRE